MLRWLTTQSCINHHPLPSYLWLPGWSFLPEIFLPWIKHLPGEHWGLDWRDLDRVIDLDQEPESAFWQLQQYLMTHPQAQQAQRWIGWSLGGWLVEAATRHPAWQPTQSGYTLASALHFDVPGLNLQAFQAQFQVLPQRSLSYFVRLCCQGDGFSKKKLGWLQQQQIISQEKRVQKTLHLGLTWLRCLKHRASFAEADIQHWVAATGTDRVCLAPHPAARVSSAASHVFFLDEQWIQHDECFTTPRLSAST